MNAYESRTPALRLVNSVAEVDKPRAPNHVVAAPPGPDDYLLDALRETGAPGPEVINELTERLEAEEAPSRLWTLLRCVEHCPPRAVDLEIVFGALCRLARADEVLLRSAAYRWLAGLHQVDLRFEMRAKRVIREGLDRETGLALRRVEKLMRLC